jgi:glycosyltransferase involved in cell wall biosynthesis
MRVLYVETPYGYGGSMQSLLELLNNLPADIHAHLVSTYNVTQYKKIPKSVCSLNVINPPHSSNTKSNIHAVYQILWWAHRILVLIRRYGIELIHSNNGPVSHLGALYAAKLTAKPILVSVRGFTKQTKMFNLGARRFNYYIAISKAIQQNLHRLNIAENNTYLLYNPITPPDFLNFREKTPIPVIGMHGMLARWKGHNVFLKALKLLRDRGQLFSAKIAGTAPYDEGDYPNDLKQLCNDLKLNDIVDWTGYVPNPYIFLAGIDLSIHASISPEPLGRVVAEAMLMGIPVIGTDGGGVPEMISHGETGWLVPMGDALALANAMKFALENMEQARQIAEQARERALDMFNPTKHTEAMLKIYRYLLE